MSKYRSLNPTSSWFDCTVYICASAASGLKPASALCHAYRNVRQGCYPKTSQQALQHEVGSNTNTSEARSAHQFGSQLHAKQALLTRLYLHQPTLSSKLGFLLGLPAEDNLWASSLTVSPWKFGRVCCFSVVRAPG